MLNQIPTIWTNKWTDELNTGTWRVAFPLYVHRLSPCQGACPLDGDIPEWIELLREGNNESAWLSVIKNNPFPATIGRICHHPCESSCNRSEYDSKVSIRHLERFLGDFALDKQFKMPKPDKKKNKKVAIIGGGPAGLSAAYQLTNKGYLVTIFEAKPQLGGMLHYAIPTYRLPKDILQQEISRLLEIGIEVKTSSPVESTEEFQRLQHEYDAIFLAVGAGEGNKMKDLEGSKNVLDGIEFLSQINSGTSPAIGNNIAVIGGGNTAIDAARAAKRLGAENVVIIYRRTREHMPVQEIELIELEEEGIEFQFLSTPIGFDNNGRLVCQKMELGENDETGRPRPVPVEQDYSYINADNVIKALGTKPNLKDLGKIFELERNNILPVDGNQKTKLSGTFAGGDIITLERYASVALAAGKDAAQSIELFLEGEEEGNKNYTNNELDEVKLDEVNFFYFPSIPALQAQKLPVEARLKGFDEVQTGILKDDAVYEAERCLSCGYCIRCDNCFYFCPDMAVKRIYSDSRENSIEKYEILEQYCKGCGLCVKECPRGAIVLREEEK